MGVFRPYPHPRFPFTTLSRTTNGPAFTFRRSARWIPVCLNDIRSRTMYTKARQHYTVTDAAQFLGVPVAAIRLALRQGRLTMVEYTRHGIPASQLEPAAEVAALLNAAMDVRYSADNVKRMGVPHEDRAEVEARLQAKSGVQ